MKNFLVYGSYGYTGNLIVEQAVKVGLKPLLAGRDKAQLATQAQRFGLEYRAFDLNDSDALHSALQEVDAVLHCAGPFSVTLQPMIRVCLQNKKHYVDISGGIEELEALARMDEEAKTAGIMVMPGGGFDVVPSDCLALYVSKKLPGAERLELNILGVGGGASRGTARSAVENMHRQGRIRRDGAIVNVPNAWRVKQVDFGRGPKQVVSVGWGDVSTAYYTTRIPNIETYMAFPRTAVFGMRLAQFLGPLLYTRFMKNFLKALIGWVLPPGPSRERNQNGFSIIIGEAMRGGETVRAKLRTPEAYYLTSLTSVEIMKRVLSGEFKPGFQTPANVYGEDFILWFAGTSREDV